MTFKRQIDRLPIIPADAKEHNVTCQFCIVGCGYKAYTWDINDQGGTAAERQQVRRRPFQAAIADDPELVLAVDVQHRQAGREGRSPRHQARCGLRRELRARLDPRRAHGGGILFRSALDAAATPDRADGVALRADAADELGRRARPRRARDRRGDRRRRAKTGCSSRPSTTAAPAAATKTPGAPASSISAR